MLFINLVIIFILVPKTVSATKHPLRCSDDHVPHSDCNILSRFFKQWLITLYQWVKIKGQTIIRSREHVSALHAVAAPGATLAIHHILPLLPISDPPNPRPALLAFTLPSGMTPIFIRILFTLLLSGWNYWISPFTIITRKTIYKQSLNTRHTPPWPHYWHHFHGIMIIMVCYLCKDS